MLIEKLGFYRTRENKIAKVVFIDEPRINAPVTVLACNDEYETLPYGHYTVTLKGIYKYDGPPTDVDLVEYLTKETHPEVYL